MNIYCQTKSYKCTHIPPAIFVWTLCWILILIVIQVLATTPSVHAFRFPGNNRITPGSHITITNSVPPERITKLLDSILLPHCIQRVV